MQADISIQPSAMKDVTKMERIGESIVRKGSNHRRPLSHPRSGSRRQP